MRAVPTLHGPCHHCTCDLNESSAPRNITLLIPKTGLLDWGCGGPCPGMLKMGLLLSANHAQALGDRFQPVPRSSELH